MTPTQTLTAAAEKLRGLAEGATPGPWEKGETTVDDPNDGPTHVSVRTRGTPWYEHLFATEGSRETAADAAYIAAMNPGVGLLLAAALEAEGRRMGGWIPIGINGRPLRAADPHLLALATEILSEGENT